MVFRSLYNPLIFGQLFIDHLKTLSFAIFSSCQISFVIYTAILCCEHRPELLLFTFLHFTFFRLTSLLQIQKKKYTEVGSYTVKLEVTDSKGAKASLEKTVLTTSNAVPIASFDVSSLNGYTASVLSTSTDSDGTFASYKRSWGDDTSNDTTLSAQHTYTQAGTYTIILSVVDNQGASSTIQTSSVTVPTALPVSAFQATVSKMVVSFDGSSCTNQFGTITSYEYDFGDSNTITTTTPTTQHAYTTVGTFTVTMNVIDDKNAQATSTKTVTTVANVAPTTSFDVSSLTGYTVIVASTSTDSDGTIASYKWSWDVDMPNDTTSSASHTYTEAGTYTISFTVVDNNGVSSGIETFTVTVQTVVPVSAFRATVNKMTVSFDASSSTKQFGTITSYVWNFGDTNTITTTTPTTSHTYTTLETFSVVLKIVDNKKAQATSTKAVTTVANNPPIASFNIASKSGYTVNVISTSTDSDGTIAVYQWNWGDGTANDTGSTATHTYSWAGTFQIKLSVKDNNEAWSSISTPSVTVPDTIPTASFTASINQLIASVDAAASSDTLGEAITSYTWNWGDGTIETKTAPTASHTYLNPNMQVISLKVANSKGVSSLETEKSVMARMETGLYPSWGWENFLLQKTVNQCKYFMSTSRWQASDGSIKYYCYFSKSL